MASLITSRAEVCTEGEVLSPTSTPAETINGVELSSEVSCLR